MKKQLFIFGLCLSATFCLNAQTNKFPTSGNVGIGTIDPIHQLQVSSNTNTRIQAETLNSTSVSRIAVKSPTMEWDFRTGANDDRFEITGAGIGYALSISKSNKYVGIGTRTPSEKLEVKGNILSTATITATNLGLLAKGNSTSINIRGNSTSDWQYHTIFSDLNGLAIQPEWKTGSKNLLLIPNGNGKVGIGTKTPNVKLQVNDDAQSGTGLLVTGGGGGGGPLGRFRRDIGANSEVGITGKNGDAYLYYTTAHNKFSVGVDGSTFKISDDLVLGTNDRFVINSIGDIGIGTPTPDSKLTVKGDIHTNEVKVDLLNAVAPDYVFYKDYDLKTLTEVETYIATEGHLPNIPSAKEMETNGIHLKKMNLKLLEKIEELTLYTIQQEKETLLLKAELQNQKTTNKILEKKLKAQETRLQKIEAVLNSK